MTQSAILRPSFAALQKGLFDHLVGGCRRSTAILDHGADRLRARERALYEIEAVTVASDE
jgi:hypothetical protein